MAVARRQCAPTRSSSVANAAKSPCKRAEQSSEQEQNLSFCSLRVTSQYEDTLKSTAKTVRTDSQTPRMVELAVLAAVAVAALVTVTPLRLLKAASVAPTVEMLAIQLALGPKLEMAVATEAASAETVDAAKAAVVAP